MYTQRRLFIIVGRRLVRLAGSGVSYKGRLEVYHDGRWGVVCSGSGNFADREAKIVCYQLGFG